MAARGILIAFCACLIAALVAGLPIFWPLICGFALFFGYGLVKGVPAGQLLRGCGRDIRAITGILVAFVFIGMLTASWRASGTIPAIVSACLQLVSPAAFPLAIFLMVSLMSVLTGTSFGTAATMGSICMALGQALGCSPIIVGGAILSGCYVGDRSSPLSTASLLVANVTHTSFTHNLPFMARRAMGPFLICCALYLALGFAFPPQANSAAMSLPYGETFALTWPTLVPALSVVALAVARADVRVNMAVSTALAVGVALLLQNAQPAQLASQLALGYTAPTAELAATLDGGGMVSMLEPGIIVLVSSTFAGLFEATDLLSGTKARLEHLSATLGREGALTLGSVGICTICCNQTLSTVITQQLFRNVYPADGFELALDIEDTSIVICGLVPWSIASSVPLAAAGAPTAGIVLAFYLMIQPIWMLVRAKMRTRKARTQAARR